MTREVRLAALEQTMAVADERLGALDEAEIEAAEGELK
jgi:hypothetical protein